jgi:hypothetical protein
MADKEVVKEEDRRFFYAADGETKYFINPPTAEDIRGRTGNTVKPTPNV